MPELIPPPGKPWSVVEGDGYRIHAHAVQDTVRAFAEELTRALDEHPRWVDSRFLYDDDGSGLFDAITDQPEYYQTRTEHQILADNAADIRRLVGESTIVELGSGSSEKTRRLIEAWVAEGPARYVPIDISPGALEPACRDLSATYPTLTVEGLASSYDLALPVIGSCSPLMLTFLGSSIGNMSPPELDRLLELMAVHLEPGDTLLIGVDLVKSPAVLEAAYNDAAGVTASFTKNLFERMNAELGCDVPLDAVEHVAYYNDCLARIEIYARMKREVWVSIEGSGARYRLARGEMLRTEISRKFRVGDLRANAARFGFELVETYTDSDELFAVLLLRRQQHVPIADNKKRAIEGLIRTTRVRTQQLVEELEAEAAEGQHSELMSPIVWDLGHVANFEERWLVRALDRSSGLDDALAAAVEVVEEADRTFDPRETPRRRRGDLELPTFGAALEQMAAVRRKVQATLRKVPLDPAHPLLADGYVYSMVAQHEAVHLETMLQAIQLRPDLMFGPAEELPVPPRPARSPTEHMILVPAGAFVLGTDGREREYDNERPAHELTLDAYRIGAAPVTNGEYLEFMNAGGYRDESWWCEAGRAWLKEADARAPKHWLRLDDIWMLRSFGRIKRLDPERPVMHVSWYEASAYARWAGKRLPTEAEWEKAASWNPALCVARRCPWGDAAPSVELGNFDLRFFEPMPVGSYPRGRSFYGCHQMLGDVWEWTSSTFDGYPGFEAFPYDEYSKIFFGDEYRVLRGGSWAMSSVATRNTLRNWDYPQRRQIFAGFRVAEDA